MDGGAVVLLVVLIAFVVYAVLTNRDESSSSAPASSGAGSSTRSGSLPGSSSPKSGGFSRFVDRFETLEQVQAELRKQGLESCNLIIAIDATKSNEWNGKRSFGGKCLHAIAPTRRVQLPPSASSAASTTADDRDEEDPCVPPSNAATALRARTAATIATTQESKTAAERAMEARVGRMARSAAKAGREHEPVWRNPYERAIAVVARTLSDFDEDGIIPAYVFGDSETKNRTVKTLRPDGMDCNGLDEVLEVYRAEAPKWDLSGPTCFGPAVDQAVRVVRASGNQFHVLVIIADGEVVTMDKTMDAIRRASGCPLAIVVIGVGDGPWDQLRTLDDHVTGRRFDNLQAVFFHEIEASARHFDSSFALAALMELPDQFRACKSLGLLG